jgi:hypothetical protein
LNVEIEASIRLDVEIEGVGIVPDSDGTHRKLNLVLLRRLIATPYPAKVIS